MACIFNAFLFFQAPAPQLRGAASASFLATDIEGALLLCLLCPESDTLHALSVADPGSKGGRGGGAFSSSFGHGRPHAQEAQDDGPATPGPGDTTRWADPHLLQIDESFTLPALAAAPVNSDAGGDVALTYMMVLSPNGSLGLYCGESFLEVYNRFPFSVWRCLVFTAVSLLTCIIDSHSV